MVTVVVGRVGRARVLRQLHRAARDGELTLPGPLRQLLDRVAIAVSCGEVHQGIGASRVLSQDLLDQADAVEKTGQSIDDSSRMLVMTFPVAS